MNQEPEKHSVSADNKSDVKKEADGIITLQGSLVNKLIKRVLKDKVITS